MTFLLKWNKIPSKHSSWWSRLEDEYILINHTSSEDVFKTSWPRRIYLAYPYVFKSLQDVFKTSSRRLQNVFKKSRKYVLKTSSRRFKDVSSSKTVFVPKSFRSIQHLCKTYCKDHCLQKDSPRSHFWEIYGKCKNLQVLVFQFTTPFSGCL